MFTAAAGNCQDKRETVLANAIFSLTVHVKTTAGKINQPIAQQQRAADSLLSSNIIQTDINRPSITNLTRLQRGHIILFVYSVLYLTAKLF